MNQKKIPTSAQPVQEGQMEADEGRGHGDGVAIRNRLLDKSQAFLLGPQPFGHLEFLPKLAQVLVSSAIR